MDMVLDALEQAIHSVGMPENVIFHSDRGLHYLPIRCTNRLDVANARYQLVQWVTHTTIYLMRAELEGAFDLGDSRHQTDKSPLPFDLVF